MAEVPASNPSVSPSVPSSVSPSVPPSVSPSVEQLVDQLAQLVALPLAPEHRPGVIANFERTTTIAQLVMEFPVDDDVEVAPIFQVVQP
jgi:Protein of unknown function (DUF4089)